MAAYVSHVLPDSLYNRIYKLLKPDKDDDVGMYKLAGGESVDSYLRSNSTGTETGAIRPRNQL